MKNLSDALVQLLSMGNNVKLDGIGTFSLSLGFEDDKPKEMQGNNDKMSYHHVTIKNINFKTDNNIIKRLRKETQLDRCENEVSKITKSPYTKEERIANALRLIHKYGFIDLQSYANVNNLSRSSASQDLKKNHLASGCPHQDLRKRNAQGLGSKLVYSAYYAKTWWD